MRTNSLPSCLWVAACAVLLCPGLASAQEASRGVELVKKEPEAVLKELYAKSWAIVVGINHYPTGGRQFPDLQAAVPDAQRVSAKLKALGFEVRTLLDKEATRKNIKRVLADDVGVKAQADDRIVFFFAGHGATREKADGSHMGYILPHDYDPEDHHSSSISMQEFRDISAQIKAKHMLYVMDSCFSGGLLQGRGQTPVAGAGFQRLKNLTQNRAHVVITAGGKDQTVKEEGGSGIFTRVFLDALSKESNMPWSPEGYVTAMDLASYVQKRVPDLAPNQSPQYGHLDGEGDVVLAMFKPMDYSAPGDRPAGVSPDIEERLRKLEEERMADKEKNERELQKEKDRIAEEARRERERLAEERRRAAEQARLLDMERDEGNRRLAREREAARLEMERAAEARRNAERNALKKRKSEDSEGTTFVPPSF